MSRHKICTKAGCGALADMGKRYCDEHGGNSNWGEKTTEVGGYGGRKWRKLRKSAMRRDGWLCQVCKAEDRIRAAEEVDHIVPRSLGGTDAMSNLQAICKPCHKAKTCSESKAARAESV